MDFLDEKKKKEHQTRLFVGYGLIAIAITFATVILVFATNGYGVNPGTGEITQHGLLFVDSHPDGSDVYLNGEKKGTTSARFVLREGTYDLELRKEGYRSWYRNFIVEPQVVERLAFPFLFPTELMSEDARVFNAPPDFVSSSPDRRWIVSHNPVTPLSFEVSDTSSNALPTSNIAVSPSLLAGRTDVRMEVIEWASDNRHLLIRASHAAGVDFLIIDREAPSESVNLTVHFAQPINDVRLRDKKADEVYVYTAAGGLLRSVNVSSKMASEVASGVISFWPYEANIVLFVTAQDAPTGLVVAKVKDGDSVYSLRDLPVSSAYLLDMAKFNGQWYYAVGTSAEGKVYVYVNPIDEISKNPDTAPAPSVLLKVDQAQYVSFSANTRFIAVQGGTKFAVFDAELGRQYKYDMTDSIQPEVRAVWMDGHRLTAQSNGKLNVFDYDGANRQELVAVLAGYAPMFDRSYNNLFTVSVAKNNPTANALIRTPLRIE